MVELKKSLDQKHHENKKLENFVTSRKRESETLQNSLDSKNLEVQELKKSLDLKHHENQKLEDSVASKNQKNRGIQGNIKIWMWKIWKILKWNFGNPSWLKYSQQEFQNLQEKLEVALEEKKDL